MEGQVPILIDAPDAGGVSYAKEFLEKLGHSTMVCQGPSEGTVCPILRGDACEMIDAAGGVVYEFDLDRPAHREILAKYKENLEEETPIRVVVTPEHAEKYSELLEGVSVWSHEPSIGELDGFAARVEAAHQAHLAAAGGLPDDGDSAP
jgi:hypothetical protein